MAFDFGSEKKEREKQCVRPAGSAGSLSTAENNQWQSQELGSLKEA